MLSPVAAFVLGLTVVTSPVRSQMDETDQFLRRVERELEPVVPLVVGRCILVPISTDITRRQYQDVVDSTLFAQLAADKQLLDNKTAASEWHNVYTRTAKWFWVTLRSVSISTSGQGTTTANLADLVIENMEKSEALARAEATSVKETLTSLQQPSNASPNSMFIARSRLGIFQVALVSDDDGQILLRVGTYHYSSGSFFSWTSSSNVFEYDKLVLHEGMVKKLRAEVTEKLGNKVNELVREIHV
ncbi:uncharacterized protein LOC134198631 [Corticium candelabrum]|uniref:uncharacterized protein LOC134198631 n=1 Tax=Corticium candelabrum TaxID=121492 RepID=UPI002E26DE86|nr:uncharacterized protein LOC134198631 [Corticium candelabrum]